MVLAFPLPAASFWDRLPIARATFDLDEALDVSRTRGGEVISADLGAALWTGKIEMGPMTHGEARAITPILNVLRRPGTSFYVADPARMAPQADPTGAVVSGYTPHVYAVGATLRDLALTALPNGYVISPGDRITFGYGSGRVALHEVVTAGFAGLTGTTDWIEVTPPIRPGLTVGTPVSLIGPVCKAVVKPGTVNLGTVARTITTGCSFEWHQTLRP